MYQLKDNEIFVFGSNLRGAHGATGAKDAYEHYGAILGCGVGMQGRSYAIPTKDKNFQSHSLPVLREYVDQFLDYAREYPYMRFLLTRIGCGLAGFREDQIAPMFLHAPENVILVDGNTLPVCPARLWVEHLKEEEWW